MASRLKLGDDLQSSSSSVRAFCNFTATSEDIRAVWKLFVPDVDLAVLAQEYEDIQALSRKPTDPRQVLCMICSSEYPLPSSLARSTTLARILVCKPQSADCERLISAYNRLKSSQRNSLEHATMGNYLYVHINMPPLTSFDPRPAVLRWITEKERSRDTPKACKQSWFSTVFGTAADDEEELNKIEKPIRRKF